MIFLTSLKQLIPALIINLIFICNAYALPFFSDKDVEELKNTYVMENSDVTIDELVRTHQYFKDGKWDTETDKDGNKCVTYTAKYDTKAVVCMLGYNTSREGRLDYMAEKVDDLGYSFTCKLIFTMKRERFNSLICEIRASEGKLFGKLRTSDGELFGTYGTNFKIKQGYVDNSNGMPKVIELLYKDSILSNSALYIPNKSDADSLKRTLRYLFLEYQLNKQDNKQSKLEELEFKYGGNIYKFCCIFEIENIEFDKKNENIIINTKTNIYDCSELDLVQLGINEREKIIKFLKERCNVIYTTTQALHISPDIKTSRMDFANFLPQEKTEPGYAELSTSWLNQDKKTVIDFVGGFKLSDNVKEGKSPVDFITKYTEKVKASYFIYQDNSTSAPELEEANNFLKSIGKNNIFTACFITKHTFGKDFVIYIPLLTRSNFINIFKDYLSKEDIKYFEFASSTKNVAILDINDVNKANIMKPLYDEKATKERYNSINYRVINCIYTTINDVSITDKSELVDSNGNFLTKTDAKGNKEQFFNYCTQNKASKLSITGLFYLDDDGKLYIDNFDLIRCNITATDSTAATNTPDSTATTNVAPGSNENSAPNEINRFQIVDVYTYETVLGLTNKINFNQNNITFNNSMTGKNEILPIKDICINIAEGEIAFRNGTPFFVVSDWQFDNHPAKGRSFPIGTKTNTGWEITQQDVDKISKEIKLYDLVKDSL